MEPRNKMSLRSHVGEIPDISDASQKELDKLSAEDQGVGVGRGVSQDDLLAAEVGDLIITAINNDDPALLAKLYHLYKKIVQQYLIAKSGVLKELFNAKFKNILKDGATKQQENYFKLLIRQCHDYADQRFVPKGLLIEAVDKKNDKWMKILVEELGWNVNEQEDPFQTPLSSAMLNLAMSNSKEDDVAAIDLIKYLREKGITTSQIIPSVLRTVQEKLNFKGDATAVIVFRDELFKENPQAFFTEESAFNALLLPANKDLLEKVIARSDFNVNENLSPYEHWKTPLFLTINSLYISDDDKIAIAKQLLGKGADIHQRDNRGSTLLHDSIVIKSLLDESVKERERLINFLISKGVDINAVNDDGKTALHLVVESHDFLGEGKIYCCDLLLRKGANAGIADKAGLTPIAWVEQQKEALPLVNPDFSNDLIKRLKLWQSYHQYKKKPLTERIISLMEEEAPGNDLGTSRDARDDLIGKLKECNDNAAKMLACFEKAEAKAPLPVSLGMLGFISSNILEPFKIFQEAVVTQRARPFFSGDARMKVEAKELQHLHNKHATNEEGLKIALRNYIARIEGYVDQAKPKTGIDFKKSLRFPFFEKIKQSQAQNRIANYGLAKDLLSELEAGKSVAEAFSESNIQSLRATYNPTRKIYSSDLNRIINDANKIVAQQENPKVTSRRQRG